MRNDLYRNPAGLFLHDVVLDSCRKHGSREAVVDTSDGRRLTYADLGDLIESCAKGLAAAGVRPADVVAIFLPNSWEYVVAVHAITFIGAIPTLLNPSYKEREVRYQLENSGASLLLTNSPMIAGMDLSGIPLRAIYTMRSHGGGTSPFSNLLKPTNAVISRISGTAAETIAALPYSSGTTGLPKGVMLSHTNLVANCYQFLAPGEIATTTVDDRYICFLPLYHIYGLNVVLNPTLVVGGCVVLMPRFDLDQLLRIFVEERITYLAQVPPVMNALCCAAEKGRFPGRHAIRATKSGAAPLAPELAKRFEEITAIPIRQGYGMTEASPVTHIGFFEKELYRPDSIGRPAAQTDCRIVRDDGTDCASGEPGELVMRGPQFMLGYWNAPDATASVMKDGWYWSGDVAVRDHDDFYKIVDRRKEMIKFKGFAIAPAEVEAILLEHPSVRDCGVVGKPDNAAGEVPIAFIVPRDSALTGSRLADELSAFVAERLSKYKQPQEIRFVSAVPRNPSGKILRKDLRAQL